MAHEFRQYEYLTWLDVERNPYNPGSSESYIWSRKKDRNDLLAALDRYAISLICDHLIVKIESDAGIFQKCMECGRNVCLYHALYRITSTW